MKSLEIVNERIEDLESRLESANYLANGNPSEFGKIFIGDLSKQLNGFKQIKQDLEVLEIIKKHLEVYIWQNIFSKEHELEVDIILKHIDNEEERYKVKQWLEENENEN